MALPPTKLGFAKISLNGKKDDIHVTI